MKEILEQISDIIDGYTIGDPEWDSKPEEWRARTRTRLARYILAEIELRIQFEIDAFDPPQW